MNNNLYSNIIVHSQVRQYVVSAARLPIVAETKPEILQMRVFARDEVTAKTKFWYNMRKLNKIKRSQGRILSVNEIFEKNLNVVKTYGIVLKYQSRTAIHNMYKEFRDTSLNGAVSQLCKTKQQKTFISFKMLSCCDLNLSILNYFCKSKQTKKWLVTTELNPIQSRLSALLP